MGSLLGLLEDCLTAVSHGHLPSADLLKAVISKARSFRWESIAPHTALVAFH